MQDSLYSKLLEDWANNNAPVFVVGPERSGTSLLFQQVSNHSAFCDFSEATVETFCFNKPWLLLEDSCPDNYEMRLYVVTIPAHDKDIHDRWPRIIVNTR